MLITIMKRASCKLLSSVALLVLFTGAVHAAPTLITSSVGYTGPGLDLSAYANGQYNFTFGPVVVDHYTLTAAPGGGGNSGLGSVIGQGSYGLGANGYFGGDATYIGVDSGTGSATLQLLVNQGPVSQLGFYMNYAPGFGNNATISALDVNGNPFATFDLTVLAPISTPGGFNQFEFRGIADTSATIYGLEFGGNYILVTGTADGSIPTPEAASSLMLLGSALGSLGMFGWITRRKATPATV